MSHVLVFTKHFQRHLEDISGWIGERSERSVLRWLEELELSLLKVARYPTIHPLARENDDHSIEIRQLTYGKGRNKYRILFTIRKGEVVILDIRHGARDQLPPDSLDLET